MTYLPRSAETVDLHFRRHKRGRYLLFRGQATVDVFQRRCRTETPRSSGAAEKRQKYREPSRGARSRPACRRCSHHHRADQAKVAKGSRRRKCRRAIIDKRHPGWRTQVSLGGRVQSFEVQAQKRRDRGGERAEWRARAISMSTAGPLVTEGVRQPEASSRMAARELPRPEIENHNGHAPAIEATKADNEDPL